MGVGVAEEEGECREVGCTATILDTVIFRVFTLHFQVGREGEEEGEEEAGTNMEATSAMEVVTVATSNNSIIPNYLYK